MSDNVRGSLCACLCTPCTRNERRKKRREKKEKKEHYSSKNCLVHSQIELRGRCSTVQRGGDFSGDSLQLAACLVWGEEAGRVGFTMHLIPEKCEQAGWAAVLRRWHDDYSIQLFVDLIANLSNLLFASTEVT